MVQVDSTLVEQVFDMIIRDIIVKTKRHLSNRKQNTVRQFPVLTPVGISCRGGGRAVNLVESYLVQFQLFLPRPVSHDPLIFGPVSGISS